ncbi:MAG: CDP-glucose 4,6-dehydratase [Elusimicrobiota bacterium]
MSEDFGGAYRGRRVLVTGQTGFKGAWLSLWLHDLGAEVAGYALAPDTNPSLHDQLGLPSLIDSRFGDVRDAAQLARTLRETRPEIVFHLAAQPLVRASYDAPADTFATNVLGAANLLDAVRGAESVRVCVVVTTDKCYANQEDGRAYREDDRLGGRDPYSASKACAELVVASYRDSFFRKDGRVSLSSARAGNVIGGGDWAADRLVPDCMRALEAGRPVAIRNPGSVRPWQHVLDPLSGYLALAARQLAEPAAFAEAWNFGPDPGAALTTSEVADLVVRAWGSGRWTNASDPSAPHEAALLSLDSSKARGRLGWLPGYGAQEAVSRTVAWYRAAREKGFDAASYTRRQIAEHRAAAAGSRR